MHIFDKEGEPEIKPVIVSCAPETMVIPYGGVKLVIVAPDGVLDVTARRKKLAVLAFTLATVMEKE
jgi:hypothetical protein